MTEPRFDPVPGYQGGLRVKETSTHFVDILPMIYTWRVVETPKAAPDSYDRGWCYTARTAAVLAAMAWDPEVHSEPNVWIKALDGTMRRRTDGDPTREYVAP